MAKTNALSKIPLSEVLFLMKLFNIQRKAENAVSIDFLPYTQQIGWIRDQMAKKFPKSAWTDKLVHRTLLRLRKGDYMEKTEQAETPPVFPPDDDAAEMVSDGNLFDNDPPRDPDDPTNTQ